MANRLAQLDRLKAEFVSVASHELKTPINVILGYVELLEDGIYGKLQDQQREVCETIAGQARNLTRLVRRLLDVSRFEAGGGRARVPAGESLALPRHTAVFVQRARNAAKRAVSGQSVRCTPPRSPMG